MPQKKSKGQEHYDPPCSNNNVITEANPNKKMVVSGELDD